MPDLDYVFVDSEMEEFVEYLLGEGFRFIPNLKFEEPEPWELNSLGEILGYMENEPFWFLAHPSFTKLPLEMHRFAGDPNGPFSVTQRSGGPTIHFACSGIRVYKGVRFVRMGHIDHYPSFWNHETGEMEKAPEAQRQAFQRILRYIKACSVVSETVGRRRAWIGRRAAEEWSRGLQLGWKGTIRPKRMAEQK